MSLLIKIAEFEQSIKPEIMERKNPLRPSQVNSSGKHPRNEGHFLAYSRVQCMTRGACSKDGGRKLEDAWYFVQYLSRV